jgi:hypothetical protein
LLAEFFRPPNILLIVVFIYNRARARLKRVFMRVCVRESLNSSSRKDQTEFERNNINFSIRCLNDYLRVRVVIFFLFFLFFLLLAKNQSLEESILSLKTNRESLIIEKRQKAVEEAFY